MRLTLNREYWVPALASGLRSWGRHLTLARHSPGSIKTNFKNNLKNAEIAGEGLPVTKYHPLQGEVPILEIFFKEFLFLFVVSFANRYLSSL